MDILPFNHTYNYFFNYKVFFYPATSSLYKFKCCIVMQYSSSQIICCRRLLLTPSVQIVAFFVVTSYFFLLMCSNWRTSFHGKYNKYGISINSFHSTYYYLLFLLRFLIFLNSIEPIPLTLKISLPCHNFLHPNPN